RDLPQPVRNNPTPRTPPHDEPNEPAPHRTRSYAATQVGGEWFEISRPLYLPMEMRWERAVADGLAGGVSHAFGIFDKTLCGIQEVGMSPSGHWWLPERENACGACREAARVIDDRWPHAMRGEDARVSVTRRL
ncbi:hypothetical protein ABZ454_35335, partial [Streptomyces sp. NPDC005803]|uniref:hypothetical protein n=1 Tax=Streptomyces sp. NPDC005803 TaxID=3154297 RepID=UPI0033CD4AB9